MLCYSYVFFSTSRFTFCALFYDTRTFAGRIRWTFLCSLQSCTIKFYLLFLSMKLVRILSWMGYSFMSELKWDTTTALASVNGINEIWWRVIIMVHAIKKIEKANRIQKMRKNLWNFVSLFFSWVMIGCNKVNSSVQRKRESSIKISFVSWRIKSDDDGLPGRTERLCTQIKCFYRTKDFFLTPKQNV